MRHSLAVVVLVVEVTLTEVKVRVVGMRMVLWGQFPVTCVMLVTMGIREVEVLTVVYTVVTGVRTVVTVCVLWGHD